MGHIAIDSGEITIKGAKNSNNSIQRVAYAPQYDPLYQSLTFRDHFYIYGAISGQNSKKIREKQRKWIDLLDMKKFE